MSDKLLWSWKGAGGGGGMHRDESIRYMRVGCGSTYTGIIHASIRACRHYAYKIANGDCSACVSVYQAVCHHRCSALSGTLELNFRGQRIVLFVENEVHMFIGFTSNGYLNYYTPLEEAGSTKGWDHETISTAHTSHTCCRVDFYRKHIIAQ